MYVYTFSNDGLVDVEVDFFLLLTNSFSFTMSLLFAERRADRCLG